MVGGARTLSPEDRPRILVVDDDEDTRQLVAFALGAHRYSVTEVADGKAALAALREASFDLVITDYDMPGLTGAEMLKRATREGTLGDASSLLVTAHPDPRDVPEETSLLRKPLDLERLLVQVREVFDLFKHAADAERDRVVFTPTLVKRSPAPRAWILGDLTTDDVVRDLLTMCGVARREDGGAG